MSTATEAKEPVAHPPINYLAVIEEYTWWETKVRKRKFVIVRVHWDFDENIKPHPTNIELLEFEKTVPIKNAWTDFINLIEAGEMIKINSKQ